MVATSQVIATTMIVWRISRNPALRRNAVSVYSFLLGLFVSALGVGATDEPVPYFEPDILPILQEHCLACHSDSPQHGLDLRDIERIVKGGESGIVVTPGSARTSLSNAARSQESGDSAN
jgi:hypothetical protein